LRDAGRAGARPPRVHGWAGQHFRCERHLARFGGSQQPVRRDFFAPHDIWLDSRGDFYVAEVVRSASGNQRPPAGDYHTLQKFTRLENATG
jgi:hypothetical protein